MVAVNLLSGHHFFTSYTPLKIIQRAVNIMVIANIINRIVLYLLVIKQLVNNYMNIRSLGIP